MTIKLGPGEQVIFQGHPSWPAILGLYIQWLLVSAALAADAAAVTPGSATASTRCSSA